VDLAEMTLPIVQDLKRFAPFGVGNSSPVLLAEQLTVTAVQSIKGTHLKATFFDGTRSLQGIFWRQTSHPALTIGGRVNAAFKAEINTFQGVTAVQAVLQAVESVS
jgi:single-stranded-DNA-specific exonuclease